MLNNPFVLIGDIPPQYFCDRQQEVAPSCARNTGRREHLFGIRAPYGQVPIGETLQ